MTLLSLVFGFARRHLRAYVSAALMLLGIAVMTVWIPRRVGHIIDGLVAGDMAIDGGVYKRLYLLQQIAEA